MGDMKPILFSRFYTSSNSFGRGGVISVSLTLGEEALLGFTFRLMYSNLINGRRFVCLFSNSKYHSINFF